MNHRIRPLIGWSKPSQRLRAEIGPTAPTNMTVMIPGERKLAKLRGLNGEPPDGGSQPHPGAEEPDWLQ